MNREWPGEEIEYLEEVLNEYSKFVQNIGQNGFSANLVLHYRTEVQETLTDLEGRAPLESYWQQTVELDDLLRKKRIEFIHEIGLQHYRLERQQVNPPKEYWWWRLDSGLTDPNKPNLLKSWWGWMSK